MSPSTLCNEKSFSTPSSTPSAPSTRSLKEQLATWQQPSTDLLARSASSYIKSKKLDVDLVACVEISDTLVYFYYRTFDKSTLFELEVELRTDERRFSRVITAVVRGRREVVATVAQLTSS